MTRALLAGALAVLLMACGTAVPGQQPKPNANVSGSSDTARTKPPARRPIAGPERPDPSFRIEPNDEQGYAFAVLPRPDGRVLLAANKLLQVLENGAPDGSFTPFDLQDRGGVAQALDASGRIYVLRSGKGTSELLRLQANGALDSSFGAGGSVKLGFHLRDVRVTANGVLLVGSAWSAGATTSRLVVARLDAQGQKDRRFAGGGFRIFPWPRSRGEGLEVLKNGRFVVAGSADDAPAVLRFNHDGSLDRNFGRDGLARIGPNPCARLFRALSISPSGKIFAAGDLHTHVIARFTRNGRLDAGFAGTGFNCFEYRFTDSSVETNFAEVTGLEAQADDSVIVAGYAMDWVGKLRGLLRFDANGTRDRSFDVDRSVVGIALDARGRLMVANMSQGVERLLPR